MSRSKTDIRARDICKARLYIEFEPDWSVGSGPTLGDKKIWKNIFPVSVIFSAKADSIILLGFECTICPQNLIKMVGAFLRKSKFFSYVNYP